MTKQHPLTDEIIEEIAQFEPDLTDPLRLNRAEDMRSAYDKGYDKGAADKFEKVIEWLLSMWQYQYMYTWDNEPELDKDKLVEDLKKALQKDEAVQQQGDLIWEFNGELSVLDFKTSNKEPQQKEDNQ